MDRSVVIKLISVTKTKNDYGVSVLTEESRDIYAQVYSVNQREFHEAGRNGLNPEFVFKVFGPDYQQESLVEYDGNRYTVYRTYQTRTDTLELYVERKAGSNG